MCHLVNNQYLCSPFCFNMKFTIAVFLLIGFIFSCGNTSDENKNQPTSKDHSVFYGNKNFDFPQLSPPAKEEAVHWGVLEDLLSEVKTANGSNLEALRHHSEQLKLYSDSLFKKIPDTLHTQPINSRLLVVKTRSELLYQVSHQDAIDSAKVQNSLNDLNIAIKNLIVQLNEKFQKDNIDYQRKQDEENELKKQQRYRDSIFNLELQDISN